MEKEIEEKSSALDEGREKEDGKTKKRGNHLRKEKLRPKDLKRLFSLRRKRAILRGRSWL